MNYSFDNIFNKSWHSPGWLKSRIVHFQNRVPDDCAISALNIKNFYIVWFLKSEMDLT